MHIREAIVTDKVKWNNFVDEQQGSFFHYFNWKEIYESRGRQYIPLLLENDSSQIIGIFPIVKIKTSLYSKLISLPEGAYGGYLLKKDLTNTEKTQALTLFLNYLNNNYSKGCSTFELHENISIKNAFENTPTAVLNNNGFDYKYDNLTGLPCTYLLELKQPFEKHIWKDKYSKHARKKIRKPKKEGVSIKEDKELQYKDVFIKMLSYTNKRLSSKQYEDEEVIKRLTIFDKKTKLFIAFSNGEPISSLLSYYTPTICYLSKMPSFEQARKTNTNMFLCNEAIKDACKNGYKYVDFGVTLTPEQTVFKIQFKGVKIPMRIYEKKYSTIKTIIEKTPSTVKWAWTNKIYIWNNKKRLVNKVIKR